MVCVSEDSVYIVIEGTRSWPQWIGNVLGSLQEPVPGFPGSVHVYFALNAIAAYSAIRDQVASVASGRRIVGIGHSLGGAVVQLVSLRLATEFNRPLRCVTFGSPRVGDPVYASSWQPGELIRVVHEGDPVPHVPPVRWAGVSTNILQPWPGPLRTYRQAGVEVGIYDTAETGPAVPELNIFQVASLLATTDVAGAHDSRTYAALLRDATAASSLSYGGEALQAPEKLNAVLIELYSLQALWWGQQLSHGIGGFPPNQPIFGGIMANWKVTFFYNAGRFGWTESYYQIRDGVAAVKPLAEELAKERIGLMGTGVVSPGFRISDEATFRDYGIFPFQLSSGAETSDSNEKVKPYSSLLCQLTSGQYRNRVFLRAIAAKNILGDDPLNLSPDFMQKIALFKARLVAGNWKMKVQARFAPDLNGGVISGATQASPIVITTAAAHGMASGAKVFIRKVKGNTAANGSWFIDVLTGTTFSLRGSTGNGVYLGDGTWREMKPAYVQIEDIQAVREVSRKTGRPSDVSRGRSRRRT